jgi:micrococcal nuclease
MTLRQSAGRALVFALLLIATPNLLAAQSFNGAVARVVDGDTFYLSGIKPSIRVWGLDAPERKQTGGTKATNMM